MKSMLNRTLVLALIMSAPVVVAGKETEAGFFSKNWTKLSNTKLGVKTGEAKDWTKSKLTYTENGKTKLNKKNASIALAAYATAAGLSQYFVPKWSEATWKGKTMSIVTAPFWMPVDGVKRLYTWATTPKLAKAQKALADAKTPEAKKAALTEIVKLSKEALVKAQKAVEVAQKASDKNPNDVKATEALTAAKKAVVDAQTALTKAEAELAALVAPVQQEAPAKQVAPAPKQVAPVAKHVCPVPAPTRSLPVEAEVKSVLKPVSVTSPKAEASLAKYDGTYESMLAHINRMKQA